MKQRLTAVRLREVLDYDPQLGVFRWRQKTGSASAKTVAGTPHKEYVRIQVDGKLHRAHRLAWLYVTGEWPSGEIDHRNNNGSDNRWGNLRAADHFTNMQNQTRAHRNNATGLLGVHQQGGKYRARIRHEGRNKSIGMYGTPEAAHAAYLAAKKEFHPGGAQ